MYSLLFGNNKTGYKILKSNISEDDAWKEIARILGKSGYTAPYFHMYMDENNAQHIDYGSHTNFFKIAHYNNTTEKKEKKMNRLFKLTGSFASFPELFKNADLGNLICRFYDGGYAVYKTIIGFTMLPNDIMLHMVDVEEIDETPLIEIAIERYGIEMRLLSTMMGESGLDIFASDQEEVKIKKPEAAPTPTPTPTPKAAPESLDIMETLLTALDTLNESVIEDLLKKAKSNKPNKEK